MPRSIALPCNRRTSGGYFSNNIGIEAITVKSLYYDTVFAAERIRYNEDIVI